MDVKWLDHGGKKVLYVDVRKAPAPEFVAAMDKSMQMLWAQPNKVAYMANVEDAMVSPEVMQHIKQHGPNNAKRITKMAVVGVVGVKKVFVDVVQLVFSKVAVPVRTFKTEEEALKWLVT